MRRFAKPSVTVSKCLGFAHCRYNGLVIQDDFVDRLRDHVEFRPVCPEMEIGLGVPRDPVRLILQRNILRLIQPATQADVTERMNGFSQSHLDPLRDVDGFILKNRSPSCGIKDVKIYPGPGKVAHVSRGAGLFGGAVLKRFPFLAVEDEGRLNNSRIREHFLTKLFAIASFRKTKAANSMRELVRFHSENKLLLMAYNQKELRTLGRIAANREKRPLDEVLDDYGRHLFSALSRAPSYVSNLNVLMHAMGYFKKGLSPKEKAFFLDLMQKYRAGRVPLSVNIQLVNSWIARFQENYLMQQTYFKPYPEELMGIAEAEKERDL